MSPVSNTTRRHPRTLAEAWPREHANPVEFYPGPWRFRDLARAVVCVAACIAIAWLAAQGV